MTGTMWMSSGATAADVELLLQAGCGIAVVGLVTLRHAVPGVDFRQDAKAGGHLGGRNELVPRTVERPLIHHHRHARGRCGQVVGRNRRGVRTLVQAHPHGRCGRVRLVCPDEDAKVCIAVGDERHRVVVRLDRLRNGQSVDHEVHRALQGQRIHHGGSGGLPGDDLNLLTGGAGREGACARGDTGCRDGIEPGHQP